MEKSDFAIYKKDGNILSMGFEFKNLLAAKGLPAMIGGGKGKFHKSDYGIPVGLALLNRQLDPNNHPIHRSREGGVIKEDLYRKLLHLGEQRKSSKSKTKKNKKKRKKKTRKLK
jgi:hypothetical protein